MRYAELKIRFIDFTGVVNFDTRIYISSSVDDGLSNQFYFSNNPVNDNEIEVTSDPADQNQAIKDLFDNFLVPTGHYETDIDDDFVYLYLTSPAEQFNFINPVRVNINSEIDNNHNQSDQNSVEIISSPDPRVLLNAFNDNIVYLEKGDTSKLELTFNNQFPITLYPSPSEGYYLNLKEAAIPLINQNNFADEITPDIENNGYLYQDPSLFLNMGIDITAIIPGGQFTQTLRYYFVKAVEQIANFKDSIFHIDNDKYYLLLPQGKVDDIHRITYYEGYPLDITFFANVNPRDFPTIKLKNLTTGHEVTLDVFQNINRLFLSQGSEDFTINDILPIQTGINRIEMVMNEDKSLMLHLKKKEPVCAPYFKFYRNRGGWGYIRFEKEFTIKNKVKDGKEIKVDYEGIQNTLTRSLTAKESSIEMEFMTEFLEDWEMENFKDFLKSPRVEMYVNDLFQKQEADSWIGVRVDSSSLDNKSLKTKRNRERVKIEIQEYTLTL